MLDKQSKAYDHAGLMALALKLFNNQEALGEWNPTIKGTTKQAESTESKSNREPKYLALLTTQLQMLTTKLSTTNSGTGNDGVVRNSRGNVVPNWKFDNPNRKKEMLKSNTTFKCAQATAMKIQCEKKEKKKSKGSEEKYQPSNNFKIALSAMLSDKDFKTLDT
eukprot:8159887-Ditylum_brightwellii.AAC.1